MLTQLIVVVGFGSGEGIYFGEGIGRECKDGAAREVAMAGQLGLLCAKEGCGNRHRVARNSYSHSHQMCVVSIIDHRVLMAMS
jgi:hypothetical protein